MSFSQEQRDSLSVCPSDYREPLCHFGSVNKIIQAAFTKPKGLRERVELLIEMVRYKITSQGGQ